jgi:hypothetical protein
MHLRMSVAERTRRAVRDDPSLYDALRAGVLNYSAAARSLDVEGDEESIATALRRFADELEAPEGIDRRVSVRLHRGVALDDGTDDDSTVDDGAPDGTGFGGVALDEDGDAAAIEASGDVDALALEGILGRLRARDVEVHAAGVAEESLIVAVPSRSGAEALRVVEAALEGA